MRPRLAVQIASFVVALAALPAPASAQGFFDWFNQRQDDRYARQNSWSGQRQDVVRPSAAVFLAPGERLQRSGRPNRRAALWRAEHALDRRRRDAMSPTACGSATGAISRCSATATRPRSSSATRSARPRRRRCSTARRSTTRSPANGARYANLENAFVYREKIVPNCTCNGKDAFGLAKIDVASDPTLKPGDIVATGDNQKAALVARRRTARCATPSRPTPR